MYHTFVRRQIRGAYGLINAGQLDRFVAQGGSDSEWDGRDAASLQCRVGRRPNASRERSPPPGSVVREVLRDLNAAGRTTVPDEAMTAEATAFVPTRWRGYLDSTRGQGRGAAYRHY